MEAMEIIDPVNLIFTATRGRFRKSRGYLFCDNCLGYYELQRWESPEDFCEQCECGGHLTFTPIIEGPIYPNNHDDQVNHSGDFTTEQKSDDLNQNQDQLDQQDVLDQIKMEWERQESIEIHEKETKLRGMPMGIMVIIFFIVLIVVLGIFSLFVGLDNVITITNF